MSVSPPPRRPVGPSEEKKKQGLSDNARLVWTLLLAPFALAIAAIGLGALSVVYTLFLAVALTLPLYVIWNVGVVEMDQIVGLSLASISLLQAFYLALVFNLLRHVFGTSPGSAALAKRANDKKEARA